MLQAEVVVEYRVRDLVDFLETAAAPEATLRVIAQQETSRSFASHDLQWLMSRGRTEGGQQLARAIQARADTLDLGLAIVDASITSLKPPGGSVARAFHRQIAAQQERETLVEKARRDAVATLSRVAGSVEQSRRLDAAILALDALRTQATDAGRATEADGRIAAQLSEIDSLLGAARGEAAELIHAARGSRWSRISAEQAARERFVGELEAHARAPRYYQAERLFAVLAEALAPRRKFVVAGDEGELPVLRMDFADPASAIETLLGE
ncbi:MAG: SPFH domain-containing protein [Planctomycetota bacterium]